MNDTSVPPSSVPSLPPAAPRPGGGSGFFRSLAIFLAGALCGAGALVGSGVWEKLHPGSARPAGAAEASADGGKAGGEGAPAAAPDAGHVRLGAAVRPFASDAEGSFLPDGYQVEIRLAQRWPTNLLAAATNLMEVSLGGRPVPFRLSGKWPSLLSTGGTNQFVSDRLLITLESPKRPARLAVSMLSGFPVADPAAAGLNPEEWKTLGETTDWAAELSPPILSLRKAEASLGPFAENGSLLVEFSHALSGGAAAASSNLVVEPCPEGGLTIVNDDNWHWDGEDRFFRVSGAFRPGEFYRVHLRDGEVETGAGELAVSTNFLRVAIPEPNPAIEFLDPGTRLARGVRPALALRSRGASRLRVEMRRLVPENLLEFVHREEDDGPGWAYGRDPKDAFDLALADASRFFDIADRAAVTTNAVSLDAFAPDGADRLPDGVWLVSAAAEDTRPGGSHRSAGPIGRFVSVSDIGLSAQFLPGGGPAGELAVWAVRLSAGAPLPGTRVRVWASNHETLAEGVTGADGLARLALPAGEGRDAYLVVAEAEGGYAYLQLCHRNNVEDLAERPTDRFPETEQALDGFLFLDRGIYRHGDVVRVQALVREMSGEAPAPTPLVFEVERPDGRIEATFPVSSDALGHLAFPGGGWTVPDSRPSGRWKVTLRTPGTDGRTLHSATFSVEDFVPPQIRVAVDGPEKPLAGPAPKLVYGVRSEYFFGAPAADLLVGSSVWFEPAPFEAEGFGPEWRFGDPGRSLNLNPLKGGEGNRLDADGRATLTFDLPVSPDGYRPTVAPPASVRVGFSASVREGGGRMVSAARSVRWDPYPVYFGVRPVGEPEPGGELALEVRCVGPDGQAPADAPGKLELAVDAVSRSFRSEWDNGRWRWREETRHDEVARVPFQPSEGGDTLRVALPDGGREYRIRVAAPDAGPKDPATEFTLGVWEHGRDVARRPGANPTRLEAKPDKASYVPGDVARVAFHAPFDGTALVTIRREKVLEQSLVAVSNGVAEVAFLVKAEHAPSLEVSAVAIRPVVPEAPGATGSFRAVGAVTLPVVDPARLLSVSLSEPEVHAREGGTRVVAECALADAAPPAGAHATFFLVDEAVLGLTGEKVPDPAGRFGRPRASDAVLWDSWRSLIRLADGPLATGVATGGDGMLGALGARLSPVKSRRFVPLAFAVSDVAFSNGVARAAFDLPEFAGEVRVTVVAWTADRTGAAKAGAVVAPKLVCQPDAPRFLAPGDRAEVTDVFHNRSGAPGAVSWSLALEGPGAVASGAAASGTVEIAAGASATVRVPVEIPRGAAPGELRVSFSARGFGEVHETPMLVPVRPAVPPLTVADAVVVPPGGSLDPARAPAPGGEGFLPLRSEWTPAAPLSAFLPAARALIDYPWGCLEQTTSRTLPFLRAPWLCGKLFPEGEVDLPALVRSGTGRVGSMMRWMGFAMWPDVLDATKTASHSVYAAWLVLAADRDEDGRLSDSARDDAKSILSRIVRDGDTDPADRAFALFALAEGGAADRESAHRALDVSDTLDPLARARLALALAKGGDPDEALALLRATPPPPDARAAAWQVLAWSEVPAPEAEAEERATAALDALSKLRPEWAWGGDWGTTTDNAAVLLAAGAWARRWGSASATAVPSGAVLRRDGTVSAFLSATNAPWSLSGVPAPGAFAVTNASPDAPLRILRSTTGLPPVSAKAESCGLTLERTFRNLDGKEVDPAAGFRAGSTYFVDIRLAPAPDAEKGVCRDLVVDALLPAGLEPVFSGAARPKLPWVPSDVSNWIEHREIRDDRVVAFAVPEFTGPCRLLFEVQAVSPGTFVLPAVRAESMFDPRVHGSTAAGVLVVRE